MHELQYLTEKDLEYFKRKQAEGDPVRIIYLSPEALDKISFKDLDRMEKEAKEEHGRQPTEEEMEEWLNEHHVITDPPQKKAEEKQEADGADSQAAGERMVRRHLHTRRIPERSCISSGKESLLQETSCWSSRLSAQAFRMMNSPIYAAWLPTVTGCSWNMNGSGRRPAMNRDKEEKNRQTLQDRLREKYGIVDEGDIVQLMDLEAREEVAGAAGSGKNPS